MTKSEFVKLTSKIGSIVQAASILNITPEQLQKYRSGAEAVPRAVVDEVIKLAESLDYTSEPIYASEYSRPDDSFS
ncbi:MAG: hypothetical protein HQL32_02335 [Planctomycetes bacterium]|nr:hypothetical protein [Planctomycetota bacterium]